MTKVRDPPGFPKYWELLSEVDKAGYLSLREKIKKIHKNMAHDPQQTVFVTVLTEITAFTDKKDRDTWKRYLVCGLCWMDSSVAVNIRQLRVLLDKCKSSINGSFQRIGYLPSPSYPCSKMVLLPIFPMLKDNYNELRQWTLRVRLQPVPKVDPTPPAINVVKQYVIPQIKRTEQIVLPLKFRIKQTAICA